MEVEIFIHLVHVFYDQLAFRPMRLTMPAPIYLLHHLTNFLLTNEYVNVIALDFSHAFGTACYSLL